MASNEHDIIGLPAPLLSLTENSQHLSRRCMQCHVSSNKIKSAVPDVMTSP